MRILYYAPNPQLSLSAQTGYGTHMREMINSWRDLGHEVDTLIVGNNTDSPEQAKPTKTLNLKWALKKLTPNYIWETLKDKKLINTDAELFKALDERVQSFKPDIIYERISYLQDSGVQVARKNGIRHVSEVNAPFPEERIYFSGKSAYLKRAKSIEKLILEESDCLTVVSSALKEYLIQKSPSSAHKMHVVPNAVNENLKKLDVNRVAALKSKFNPKNKLVVGFVGSIFPYHGVDLLIKAFKSSLKDAVLLIVGDGESIPELKKYVEANSMDENVFFTGSVPHRDVFHYIEIMDICCMMNSNWYGSPVKIFEYGLMNKAVIAPDVRPVQDVMVHGKDGFLVSNSLNDICESLKTVSSDNQLRQQIAESWNKKVLENYTWKITAQKTLSLCT